MTKKKQCIQISSSIPVVYAVKRIHRKPQYSHVTEKTGFQALVLEAYQLRYDSIILQGMAENPTPQKLKGKRGRTGKGKILCLLEMLCNYKEDILRFASDWTVPFANNEAERTIRFSKVKQKNSGCFRTEKGAQDYMQIMSFVSTARKRGISFFEAVRAALAGNALTLVDQWGGKSFSFNDRWEKVIRSSKITSFGSP